MKVLTREEIKDIVHGTLAAKGVTRWRSGYRDEEMESWLNEIAAQILLDYPDEEKVNELR